MAAALRLKGKVVRTPVLQSKELGNGTTLFLKLENEQHTGSFKYRGALNKILSLGESPPPLITASTGNHGLAISMILQKFNLDGTVYVPTTAAGHKIDILQKHSTKIVFHGVDGIDSELEAQRVADKKQHVFISPYNDWQIIGGQGTLALEILEQVGPLDYIFASVGGGGLISGIALALKAHLPTVKIVGCSPEQSNIMQKSVESGHIIAEPQQPTLSDGTAGGIEPDTVTLALCTKLVDDWATATETEITNAMRSVYQEHRIKIEGAAAVSVACFLKYRRTLKNKRVVVVLCGGNISDETFNDILNQDSEPLLSPTAEKTDTP